VRNQGSSLIALPADTPFQLVEAAAEPRAFRKLPLPATATAARLTTSGPTANDPPAVLLDGKLAQGYGPVFPNGVRNGAYKLDLGHPRQVTAITAWSHNQNGNRARQSITIFGSDHAADPGWDTANQARFTPLGSIDSGSNPNSGDLATSLRARPGRTLGSFRWIVWECSPVTRLAENTAWQELAVEAAP
jgi:hypothetical protein